MYESDAAPLASRRDPREIRWYVNDQQYHKRTLGVEGVSFIPFQPNYIILNTAIQPDACPPPTPPTLNHTHTPPSPPSYARRLLSRVSALGSACSSACNSACRPRAACSCGG